MSRYYLISLFLFFTLFLQGIFLTKFLPFSYAHETALIIWIDDSSDQNILSRRVWKTTLKKLEGNYPQVQFRSAFISTDRDDFHEPGTMDKIHGRPNDFPPNAPLKIFEKIARILPEENLISYLVLVTHGDSYPGSKTTHLQKLGGFNDTGPFGKLKAILNFLHLKKELSSSLHIYLGACFSLPRTENIAMYRANGLAEYLHNLGVDRVSLWGASGRMISVRQQESPKWRLFFAEHFSHHSPLVRYLIGISTLFLAATGAAEYSNLWPGLFYKTLAVYGLGLITLELLIEAKTSVYWFAMGSPKTNGWLYTSDNTSYENGIQRKIQRAKAHSEQAYFGKTDCKDLLP